MEKDLMVITDKYHLVFNPIYQAQNELINGTRLATAEELEMMKEFGETLTDNQEPLPEFWLSVFKNCAILREEIGECDHEILKSLQKIEIDKFGKKDFALIFTFGPNDYFTNSVLRKSFFFEEESQNADWSESDKIEWNKGKNVTIKITSKK